MLVASCSSQPVSSKPADGSAKPIQEVSGAFDSAPTATASPTPALPEVRVGETGRADGLELSVEQAKSAATVKKLFTGAYRAEGRFVIVPVAIKNVGKEPFSMLGFMSATLTDGSGATYNLAGQMSSDQTIRAKSGFSWEINPSSKGKVVLVFDLPKEAQPSVITVNDIVTIRF